MGSSKMGSYAELQEEFRRADEESKQTLAEFQSPGLLKRISRAADSALPYHWQSNSLGIARHNAVSAMRRRDKLFAKLNKAEVQSAFKIKLTDLAKTALADATAEFDVVARTALLQHCRAKLVEAGAPEAELISDADLEKIIASSNMQAFDPTTRGESLVVGLDTLLNKATAKAKR